MPILIDTNVLSDIIYADPVWEPWAEVQITKYFGDLLINPIIYAELACRAQSLGELESVLAPFELGFVELPKEALFIAAHAFLEYRKRGGAKTSPLPDFFIGAHAVAMGIPLLTRDAARYRTYFPQLELITP